MSARRAVAGRIGKLGLDKAFTEADTRSMAGQACVTCQPDRAPRERWERIARFHAVGDALKARTPGAFPKSA